MKIIYLAAYKAYHPGWDIDYQDINGKRDIPGDMLDVDLTPYDVIIATPPCNYWSRARGSNKPSKYAIDTAHLLPSILFRLCYQKKYFIVENVRNQKKFSSIGLFDLPGIYVYEYGRHTYWTNFPFNPFGIIQVKDFSQNGNRLVENPQGGLNVHNVVEWWLQVVYNNIKERGN